MKIRDVMTTNLKTVNCESSLMAVAKIMRDEDVGIVPICENGEPVGLLTDRDIVIRAVAEGPEALNRPLRTFLTDKLVTIGPDTDTKEAADLMAEKQLRRLLVCEGGRLCGIVSLGDLAVKEDKEKRMGETLHEISKPA